MWIDCKISCVDREMQELGVDSGDIWVPGCFNTEAIECIKVYLDDDGNQVPEQTVIWFKSGESVIIDRPYDYVKSKVTQVGVRMA